MKILLLADIHANWPALSAIRETFDVCLFLGDVVDYATDPLPCIEWVRKYAHVCVRGNHDHSVAQRVLVRPGGTFSRRMAAAMRPRHFEVLGDEHLTWLAQMPVTRHLTLGDHRFLLVHATPRDPMDEYIGDNVEHWQQRLEHVDVDFVCVGHTHIPMHLHVGKTQVINPGSVGQPRYGDARAVYAGRFIKDRWSSDAWRTISMEQSSICAIARLKSPSSRRRRSSCVPEAAQRLTGIRSCESCLLASPVVALASANLFKQSVSIVRYWQ